MFCGIKTWGFEIDFDINQNVKCAITYRSSAYDSANNLRLDKFKNNVWILKIVLENMGFSVLDLTRYSNGYHIVSAAKNRRSHIAYVGTSGDATMSGETDEIISIFVNFAHACSNLTYAACKIVVDNLEKPMPDLGAKKYQSENYVKLIEHKILSGFLEEYRVVARVLQTHIIGPRLSAAKLFAKHAECFK